LADADVRGVGRQLSVQSADGWWTTRIGVATWSGDVLRSLGRLSEHAGVRSISIEKTSLDEVYAVLAAGARR
jgi:hypothetical protein